MTYLYLDGQARNVGVRCFHNRFLSLLNSLLFPFFFFTRTFFSFYITTIVVFHAALSPSEGGISRQLHVVELTVSSPHDPKHLISLVFFSQSFHTFYSTVSFPPRPTMFVHPLDHLYALRASLSFIHHLKFPQASSPLLFYRNIVFFLTWEKKNDNTLALNRLCIKWFLICFPLTLSMRWRFNFNLFSFFYRFH